jgi:hypothetical protein
MKKFVIGVIAVCLWACASVCSAAYLIHLKDGREITTSEYREEGGQIKIKQYGGVVGISKEDVVSIEEIDDPKTIVVKSAPEPPKKTPPKIEEEVKTSIKENGGQKEKEGPKSPKDKVKREKNPILEEFDGLQERCKNLQSMSKEEIHQFDKDLAGLRNKILRAGLGGAYTDHLVALSEMGDKAEEMYKKRGQ